MPGKELLSIAEISRELEVPESTLHYWKNRFSQYLPSVGSGRQKRFKPGAVDVFQIISKMLGSGHTAKDVMGVLSRQYPVNVSMAPANGAGKRDEAAAQPPYGAGTDAVQIGAAIGAEIAKAIIQSLQGVVQAGANGNGNGKANGNGHYKELGSKLSLATDTLADQSRELDTLKVENDELKSKMGVLESELVRLRKDRREMERFLLDKLKRVTT